MLIRKRSWFYTKDIFEWLSERVHYERTLRRLDHPFFGFCYMVVESAPFHFAMAFIIAANVIIIGDQARAFAEATDEHVSNVYDYFDLVFVAVYLAECCVKLLAQPVGYWCVGYNVLDFGILCLALGQWGLQMVVLNGADSVWFQLISALRILRMVRLFQFVPSLQLIVRTLIKTMQENVLDIVLLLLLITFIFGVLGHYLFGLNPEQSVHRDWGTLGNTFYTLFVYFCADGWLPYQEKLHHYNYNGSEVYTAIYIFLANMIISNLFIGVICQNVNDANQADQTEKARKRKIAKMIKQELFLRKQRKDMNELVAKTASGNRNFQEMLKEMVGNLRHEDVVPMTHFTCNLTWLETYAVTLTHQENTMYRCQQLHFGIAQTLAEIVDRRLKSRMKQDK
ncbi:Cation channel sperm-associated protein 3 [Phlyctochytrium bullatum]|nr:Cation channel sperm-associated protein 3 [Phlyctochytrium bullatum]